MNKYRVGLIGHGAFGRFCLAAYQEMKDVEVVEIAGINAKEVAEVAKQFRVPSWTTDYKLMLLRTDIDAVAIFTPPHLHHTMAMEAIKAHKAFLCEKPLALSLAEANEIVKAAKHYKVPGTIGYIMRYEKIYRRVKEIALEKKFGKVKHLQFENYASSEGLGPKHWLWDSKRSGGLLVEHGVHFFDIFTNIVGQKPLAAKSFSPKPNEVWAVVRYPDNVVATFVHLFDKPGKLERNYARVVFEKGYAEITGWIPLELKLEWQDERGQIRQETEKISQDKQDYYKELVQEVLRDLLLRIGNPRHEPRVTLEDARDSLALALKARKNRLF